MTQLQYCPAPTWTPSILLCPSLCQRLGTWVGLLAVGLSVRARGYEPKQCSACMSGWVLQLLLPLLKALRTPQRETRVVLSHPSIHLGLLRWNASDRPSEKQEKEKQNITNSGGKKNKNKQTKTCLQNRNHNHRKLKKKKKKGIGLCPTWRNKINPQVSN